MSALRDKVELALAPTFRGDIDGLVRVGDGIDT